MKKKAVVLTDYKLGKLDSEIMNDLKILSNSDCPVIKKIFPTIRKLNKELDRIEYKNNSHKLINFAKYLIAIIHTNNQVDIAKSIDDADIIIKENDKNSILINNDVCYSPLEMIINLFDTKCGTAQKMFNYFEAKHKSIEFYKSLVNLPDKIKENSDFDVILSNGSYMYCASFDSFILFKVIPPTSDINELKFAANQFVEKCKLMFL